MLCLCVTNSRYRVGACPCIAADCNYDIALVLFLQTPFTAEERSSFYENVLLKHDETYTDQFMADAHVYNDHFKSLLLNYRQVLF